MSARVEIGRVAFDAPDGFTLRLVGLTAPAKPAAAMPGRAMLQAQAQFQRTVIVTVEGVPKGTSGEQYHAAQREQTMKQLRDFNVVDSGAVGKLSYYESHATGPNGAKVGSVTGTVVVDEQAFTISASALVGVDYNATKKEYLALFATVR